MYICQCCGGRFTTPALCRESRGEYFGYQAYEEILGCPYCGGHYEYEPTFIPSQQLEEEE